MLFSAPQRRGTPLKQGPDSLKEHVPTGGLAAAISSYPRYCCAMYFSFPEAS